MTNNGTYGDTLPLGGATVPAQQQPQQQNPAVNSARSAAAKAREARRREQRTGNPAPAQAATPTPFNAPATPGTGPGWNFFTETVTEIVRAKIEELVPRETIITINNGDQVTTLRTRQHYLFPLMIKIVSAGVNLALVGPSQSGKTTAAINAAKVLTGEENVIIQPKSMATTKADIFSFINATGHYSPSSLYTAMKKGLVYIADEFDCCNPGIATLFNAAISNRVVTFPNGETVTAHENFRVIVCMNTVGTGATAAYVGRNRLDAATLARFVYLEVPYDTGLEASVLGIDENSPDLDVEEGGTLTAAQCLERSRAVRAGVERAKLPHTMTPRDTFHAYALSKAGIGAAWIDRMIFTRQMTPEQVKAVGVVQ